MVPASDAAASRWLLYTAAIPSGFLTKPRYTLPPRVWPWGCHFCSCNCPGIEAAWVSHAERLSHFSEKLQGHVARPEESWGDRQEGVFQEYKMWQLAWYKCACGSLAYLSRNTETWPSLGQHEKNKKTKQNKTTHTSLYRLIKGLWFCDNTEHYCLGTKNWQKQPLFIPSSGQ